MSIDTLLLGLATTVFYSGFVFGWIRGGFGYGVAMACTFLASLLFVAALAKAALLGWV